jgi:hypothetical protein
MSQPTLPLSDDTICAQGPTAIGSPASIIKSVSVRAQPIPSESDESHGLVLLAGGTAWTRASARRGNDMVIDQSASIVASDVESLLRIAPSSRVVIVCGELEGVSATTVERLVRERAPDARLIRA